MARWFRSLDIPGQVAVFTLILLVILLLYPFAQWLVAPRRVYGIPTVESPPSCVRPVGYARLEVPIQPRLEYLRYVDNPFILNVSNVVFAIPFDIHLLLNNGRCSGASHTGTGNPHVDGLLDLACNNWQNNLHYSFPVNGRIQLRVFPGGNCLLRWVTLDPNAPSFPACIPNLVCYAISAYPQWSAHLVPLVCNISQIQFTHDAQSAYTTIANHCRVCLNLPAGFNI